MHPTSMSNNKLFRACLILILVHIKPNIQSIQIPPSSLAVESFQETGYGGLTFMGMDNKNPNATQIIKTEKYMALLYSHHLQCAP